MSPNPDPTFLLGQKVVVTMGGSTEITVPLPQGDVGDWVKITLSSGVEGTVHKMIATRKYRKYQILFTFPAVQFTWTVDENSLRNA